VSASELLASPDYELLCAGLDVPQSSASRRHELCIPALDGIALAATLYEPAWRTPRLALVINGATAVPRGYYRHFAEHLAAQGCMVLSYDYRGVGGSRDAGRGARMLHWGECDLPGALEWMFRYYPRLPLTAIGHSAGGWLFGLAHNNRSVEALLGVGAQYPHWRHWPTLPSRLAMWGTMRLAVPGLSRAFGRLPGLVFGGDSLPPGVALDWARWSSHPDFLVDDAGQPLREHFEQYRNPVRLLAIEDDIYAPIPAVRALAPLFGANGASSEVQVLRPREHGLRRLGHFGFFRRGAPRPLWDEALRWLQLQAGV
jgi:predicted alpha/beta hydrolase